MSQSNDTPTQHAKSALMDAKLRLDMAIKSYTRNHLLGSKQVASIELHEAVIDLWWRMRPNLRGKSGWENVEEIKSLDQDYIWKGRHPQTGQEVTLNGLKDLKAWIDMTVTTSETVNGPNTTRGETKEIELFLPEEAALNAAEVLTEKFYDFGWDVQRDDGLPGQDEFDPTGEEIKFKDKSEMM